jgi:hypothetical protein
VPFFTARFRPNFRGLWSIGTECHVWRLKHTLCLSLRTDFDQTYARCSECVRSAPYDVCIAAMQW